MERIIQITNDGSHTIAIPQMEVTYHSTFGAVRESNHVFINAGLAFVAQQQLSVIHIFEMGFGTGLNALLTLQWATENKQPVYYHSVELYPLTLEEAAALNYSQLPYGQFFMPLHEAAWNKDVPFNDHFKLHKMHLTLHDVQWKQQLHLIYYDAFAPNDQPDLWTKEVFDKLYKATAPNGVLVTYCSKGDVRRVMLAAGFEVKKLAGPPGKFHILRAIKSII